MNTIYPADPVMAAFGLLVARLVIGLLMAAHGTQKLFGWFGGYGLNTTGEFFVQLGFERGRAFAALASVAEVASGLLVTLGFLGPVGPALMISVMLVAAISVHWKLMKIAAATKPMRTNVGSTPVIAPMVEATPATFASLRSSEYG